MIITDAVKVRIWFAKLAQVEARTADHEERERLLSIARRATFEAYKIAGASTTRGQDKVWRESANSFCPHKNQGPMPDTRPVPQAPAQGIPGWRNRQ